MLARSVALELDEEVGEHEPDIEVGVDPDPAATLARCVATVVVDARREASDVAAGGRVGLERRLERGEQNEWAVAENVGFAQVETSSGGQRENVEHPLVEVGADGPSR